MLRRAVLRILAPLLLATILIAVIAFYCFGDVQGIAAFLKGQELTLVSECSLHSPDVVKVLVRNLTKNEVRIVGARSSCSCLILDDVPGVIPAFSKMEGRAIFHTSPEKRLPDKVAITLFTSASRAPVLTTQCCNPAALR